MYYWNERSNKFRRYLSFFNMATTSIAQGSPRVADTKFDRRLSEILDFATEVFAEKGYEGASIRDLSRLSGISLAGLYYYFDSKEKLLYYIQKHTFTTIIERLRERLAAETEPERRLRIFVHNHVQYALEHDKAMKVLSHEDDVLRNGYGVELAKIKREYYQICFKLVEDVLRAKGANGSMRVTNARTAVMSLFGAINWLYTWHNTKSDPSADTLAHQISDLYMQGIRGVKPSTTRSSKTSSRTTKAGPLAPSRRSHER
jgi:AcrR family transcriptional regulator